MAWTTQRNPSKLSLKMRFALLRSFEPFLESISRAGRSGRLAVGVIAAVGSAMAGWQAQASPVKSTEVRVMLFGQPCTLSGPFDEATLRAIHSISPEQVYPAYLYGDVTRVASPEIKRALEKVHKTATPVPALLDHYREAMGKRLDEMLPFFEGLEEIRKTGSSKSLVKNTKKLLVGKKARGFIPLAKKLERKTTKASAKADPDRELKNKLFEIYDGAIEPDPQEEFHRAIHRLNVNYACSYEESDDEDTE